jgi:DNA-binding MarR family transcriptional regulator
MATLRKLKLSCTCTVSELAEWMGVTSATVTGITNKLVSQNLIQRWREESDRRVVRLKLTTEGSEMLSHVERLRREKTSRILIKLQEEDLRKLADILERLVIAIES